MQDSNLRYNLSDKRTFISPHRGFDLTLLLRELDALGEYREIVRSPFTFLPKIFNQVVLYEFELTVREANEIVNKISKLYTQ